MIIQAPGLVRLDSFSVGVLVIVNFDRSIGDEQLVANHMTEGGCGQPVQAARTCSRRVQHGDLVGREPKRYKWRGGTGKE